MGVTLNYYFNYPKEINELISDLNDQLWFSGWHEERYSYWCRFLGIVFWIPEEHGLVNDSDMDFESYRFCMSTKMVYRPAMFHHTQLAVMLSLIYMFYERMGIKGGMLGWDVQKLLAKYEERNEGLYDLVSETPFTNFSEHMKTIEQRLPLEWRD